MSVWILPGAVSTHCGPVIWPSPAVSHPTRPIRGGDSVADLVQDLFDLGTLYEGRIEAFGADQSFDAPARIAEARAVAQQLSVDISDERFDLEPARTLDMRNRAFTYLDDQVRARPTSGSCIRAAAVWPKAQKAQACEFRMPE